MKNKISLLISASALAFMACSSLEVSNPEEENFPAGWSVAEYMKVNPDLRALQIRDQVIIMNTKSGIAASTEDAAAFETIMGDVAVTYAGFTAATWDATDASKLKYIKDFNINGATNEMEVLATLELDSAALEQQYVAYGRREGRPYRTCTEGEGSVVKGDCQSTDIVEDLFPVDFSAHLYCSRDGKTYCIDCAASDECPVISNPVVDPTPASSAAAAPASSAEAAEPAPASSAEAAEPAPESSAAAEPAVGE